jgi:hypothetical protein
MIAVVPVCLTGFSFPRHSADNLALVEVENLHMAFDIVNFVSRGYVSLRDQAKAQDGALSLAMSVE